MRGNHEIPKCPKCKKFMALDSTKDDETKPVKVKEGIVYTNSIKRTIVYTYYCDNEKCSNNEKVDVRDND